MDPSGNAIAAAISSRSGVSGMILSGVGVEAMAQQHMLSLNLTNVLFGLVLGQQVVMTSEVELAARDLL
jgi:hypothetical protein